MSFRYFVHFAAYMANRQGIVIVPDRRRRIGPEVVVVRRWAIWLLGIWRGRVWGNNLRPRWTDPVTARRVPSK